MQEPKKKTVEHTENFKDFAQNAFKITISRIQQLALQKAGGKLPTPAEQLQLVKSRREKKKSRMSTAKHVLICRSMGFNVLVYFTIQSDVETMTFDTDKLRKYHLLCRADGLQDGWTCEFRRRLEGKAAGQLYKVWTSPKGQQLWTKSLGTQETLVAENYLLA